LRLESAAGGHGPAALAFRAWDGTAGKAPGLLPAAASGGAASLSAQAATASLTVNHVNHAPVWTGGGVSLTPVRPGTASPVGDTVTAIFGASFRDVDGDPVGIAVTALPATSG